MKLERLLVTGAAGGLGRVAREGLKGIAPVIRLSDLAEMAPAGPGEEVVRCDLADRAAVRDLVKGCDGILHLGGVAVEAAFDDLMQANLLGLYNLYEAARKEGAKRLIFASSNHAIGFHERETRLDASAPLRPDSLYGVTKCFGEAVARYYWDKFGLETAILRIGSCFPEPRDRRMLATWLAPEDFLSFVRCVFSAPRVGCPIVYGASDNEERWWDNSAAAFLGWRPKHSSERFRAAVEAREPERAIDEPAVRFQGGGFAAAGHFED